MTNFPSDEGWKDGGYVLKVTLPLLVVFIVICAFWARGAGLFSDKLFSRAEEQVRHDTFKESQAYNDGMVSDLDGFYTAYHNGTTAQQAAIKSVVLHRTSTYPVEKLPEYLRTWITQLRNDK